MLPHHSHPSGESQSQTLSWLAWESLRAALGDAGALERIAGVTASQDWMELVDEADRLRLSGLLYPACREAAAQGAALPAAVLAALHRQARLAAARHARLAHATAQVVGEASARGLRLLVLKGIALSSLVYPDGVMREMDDVDLLVAPADLARLTDLLKSLGYRNDLRGEEDFFPVDRSHSIDVHRSLINATRLPRSALFSEGFQPLWERSQPIRVGGVEARALGPADTLAHLALHAVHHHGLAGGRWLADLVLCLRRWPAAAKETARHSPAVCRSLWYCLEALALRGEDPAPAVRRDIRPLHPLPGERRLVAATARGELGEMCRYAFTLVCLPRAADKVRFLYQLIVPAILRPATIYNTGFADAAGPGEARRLELLKALVRGLRGGWMGWRPRPSARRKPVPANAWKNNP